MKITDLAIFEAAARHSTKMSWHNSDLSTYQAAQRRGLLDIAGKHMEAPVFGLNRRWSNERIMASALRYETRSDWSKGDPKAYDRALYYGIVDEATKHMKPKAQGLRVRAIYALEFKDSVYVGLTCNIDRRKAQHLNNSHNKAVANKVKTEPYKFIVLNNHVLQDEAGAEEREWMRAYQEKGFCLLNSAKGGSLGTQKIRKWPKEFCIAQAKKYGTHKDWKLGHPASCNAAEKRGWMPECKKYLTPIRKSWNKDRCIADAKKYKSRSEWQRKEVGAYTAALKNGWSNECCKHMQ